MLRYTKWGDWSLIITKGVQCLLHAVFSYKECVTTFELWDLNWLTFFLLQMYLSGSIQRDCKQNAGVCHLWLWPLLTARSDRWSEGQTKPSWSGERRGGVEGSSECWSAWRRGKEENYSISSSDIFFFFTKTSLNFSIQESSEKEGAALFSGKEFQEIY